MHGCTQWPRWCWGGFVVALTLAGCTHLPGQTVSVPVQIAPTQVLARTVQLGDMPLGDRLAVDATPDDATLAQWLGAPNLAATLAQLGRTGGSYRVFTFTAPEPGAFNATVRATIEIDLFPGASPAAAWVVARQPTLADAGPELAVAAPGQHHHAHMQSFTAGDTVATTTTLSFTEGNAAIEITTLCVGPNASLADAERFAALIDDRLQQSG
jgi:hypothetical protein